MIHVLLADLVKNWCYSVSFLVKVPAILSSIACNLDVDILSASFPLLSEARVEAIEWSFDALHKKKNIPPWFLELLHTYGKERRLIGHGIFFSLFSGRWTAEQEQWLRQLKQVAALYNFDHVTEHFGFMTGEDFHSGAPLSIPYTNSTLAIGRDRLARIQDACGLPVGLENLAFSYAADDVKRHGDFLEQLVSPVNGFIILDLHNLYCQLHNFSLPFDDVIRLYPLERVREIHISGGSWEPAKNSPGRKVRRDTHDSGVPSEVFELLKIAIDICPNLKYVVLEQLGTGLKTASSRQQFYDDFLRMQEIVAAKNMQGHHVPFNSFAPTEVLLSDPLCDEQLYRQQIELSNILETAACYDEALHALCTSSLANTAWEVEKWEPYMLETAMNIAQKWKKKVNS